MESYATEALFKDFEDSTLNYTLSSPEASDGTSDYWGRIDSDGGGITIATPPKNNESYDSRVGTGYF